MLPKAALLHSTFAFLALAPTAFAGDWPCWRGSDHDGVSRETDWVSAGAAANLWEAQVGLGYSSVAVADGRAYTLGHAADAGLDVLWCFDAESGEVLWTHEWPAKIWKEMHSGGTLTTPSVAGESVFVVNREGRFFRFDAKSGKVELERDLAKEFSVEPPKWGFSGSPLVLDEGVVLNLGKVFLLDAKGVETKWSSAASLGAAYSTPVPLALDGKPRLAVFDGDGLSVLDRATGERVYFQEWKTRYEVNAATPVVVGERVFISSGQGRGAGLVAFEDGAAKLVWENKVIATKLSGCVLMGELLYGFDESVLKCVDLEGKERWLARGLGDGCLIGAGDRLLVLSGKGELVVVQATPDEFRELARQQVLEGGKYWTTPTLANGLVYCRNSEGRLVCRDHRAPK